MDPLILLLAAATESPAGVSLKYGGAALAMFLMGVGLIRWSVRTYLENSGIGPVKGLKSPTMSPQFRMLREMGLATGDQLGTMGAAEREQLFALAMTRKAAAPAEGAERVSSPAAATSSLAGGALLPPSPAPSRPAGFRVSCSRDSLFCPACGATIGDRRTPIGYITSCLACKRVLAARLEGDRVTIESA